MKYLLYGANGYTAQLIIEQSRSFGLTPVLAGRNATKIRDLASKHDLEYHIVDLAEADKLAEILKGYPVVLHCAGPFIHTASPMMEACMRTGTHYLDITGEIEVFEQTALLDARAKAAHIMLLPGVGLDVVPTDCLALYLKNQLPDATHLQLAIGGKTKVGISRGTMMTMIETLGEGGMVRIEGKLTKIPIAQHTLKASFAKDFDGLCASLPWGDVATAYYTTGIGNVESFFRVSRPTLAMLRLGRLFDGLVRKEWVRNIVRKRTDKTMTGPDEEARQKGEVYYWGKVWNANNESVQARLRTPESYHLTALTALTILKKVVDGHLKLGYQTPASCFGADLILEIPGTEREIIR